MATKKETYKGEEKTLHQIFPSGFRNQKIPVKFFELEKTTTCFLSPRPLPAKHHHRKPFRKGKSISLRKKKTFRHAIRFIALGGKKKKKKLGKMIRSCVMMLRTFSCGWFVMVEDFFGGGRSGLVVLKGGFLAEFNRSVAALVIDVLEFELLVSREWIIWLVRV